MKKVLNTTFESKMMDEKSGSKTKGGKTPPKKMKGGKY